MTLRHDATCAKVFTKWCLRNDYLAIVPFNVGCVELTLCLSHLFVAHRTHAQAIRFVNHFLAVLVVIGSVDYAKATSVGTFATLFSTLLESGTRLPVLVNVIVGYFYRHAWARSMAPDWPVCLR